MDAEDRWSAWQWHQCGNNTVCIESVIWENYYLYPETIGNDLHVAHSNDPQNESWTKNNILDFNSKTGIMKLKSHSNEETFHLKIYIPIRCYTYKRITSHHNTLDIPFTYSYTANSGITKTFFRSQNLSAALSSEIGIAISVGLEPSLSLTYVWEDTVEYFQAISTTAMIVVPSRQRNCNLSESGIICNRLYMVFSLSKGYLLHAVIMMTPMGSYSIIYKLISLLYILFVLTNVAYKA